MIEKLMKKGKKSSMSDTEKEAKLSVLSELRKICEEAMGEKVKGLKDKPAVVAEATEEESEDEEGTEEVAESEEDEADVNAKLEKLMKLKGKA